MSTGQRTKILDYLPPEEKQKLVTLIQRLQQQTQQRQKFQALYEQSQQSLNDMTRKYSQLQDQNKLLKQQIHNSFSMVSQVRANFQANQQRRTQKQHDQEEEWQEDDEESDEQNHQNSLNQINQPSRPPKSILKTPLEKYRPPMTTNKKSAQVLNLTTTQLNNSHLNSSRSKQINDLKKEINEMQQQKRRQEQRKKKMKEKLRLVDEIKNRYRSNDDSMRKSTDSCKQTIIERIDITHTFQQDQPSHRSKEKYKHPSHEKTRIKHQKTVDKVQSQAKPKQVKWKSPGKGHIVTSDDYDDVLDLINCNN